MFRRCRSETLPGVGVSHRDHSGPSRESRGEMTANENWLNGRRVNCPSMSGVSALTGAVQGDSNAVKKITIGIAHSCTHRYSYLTGPVRSRGNV
jgi:hypothetical protein